jgi:hypothetical protein
LEQIVGCLGFVGFEFRLGDRINLGGWTHNWHAEMQGEGGLLLLGRFAQVVDNRFLLRLNDVSGAIVKLLRVPFLPAIPRWWAALEPERAAELFGLVSDADRAVLRRSAARFRTNAAPPSGEFVRRLDAADEFLLAGQSGVTGYVRRTGRYLNWRYVDIPRHNYRIIRTDRAFCVYRIETVMGTDAGVIRVLEWTFNSEDTPGAIARIMEQASSRNPVLIDFHCTCESIAAPLEALGFVAQSATLQAMPDMFRPTNRSGGYAVAIDLPPHRSRRSINFEQWYVTAGDSDIDRVKL